MGVAGAATAAAGNPVAQARQIVAANNAATRASQKRVDALDDQTSKLLTEYRAALRQTGQLDAYVAQVQPLLAKQAEQVTALKAQVAGQGDIGQQMLPLMLQMADSLAQFVKLDLPFLQHERTQRIANLQQALADPSVPLAGKFKRLAQAYRVEANYGRDLGQSQREIVVGGHHTTVDVLRIGRVVLLYETPDGNDTGYWSAKQNQWVSLGGRYRRDIREALRIARGDLAATPLPLPVPAAATEARR